MVAPQQVTREQLQRLLGNDQRLIIAFENLLSQAGEVLPGAVEEAMIAAESAISSSNANNGAIERIASALEVLALSPVLDIQKAIADISLIKEQESANLLPSLIPEYIDESSYGEMYNDNTNVTTTISAVDTPTEVTSGFTGGELRLCSFGGSHYLQVERNGIYRAVWSQSVGTTAAGDEIEGGLMVDGVASAKGSSHGTISTANSYANISGSALLNLSATNQVSLFVDNHSAVRNITTQHASLTLNLIRRLS